MTFADHFSSLAARYATYRPRYPAALAEALVTRCSRHDLAWDAGCGNGQLSTALAECFARVIATEPATAQLADAEAHPRVEYREETAERSSLADASADLAIAAQAAHWFDWPRYVAEVTRVARPGALVGIVGYADHVAEEPAHVACAPYFAAVEPYWPAGREILRAGYRDLAWPWPAVECPPIAMTASWTRDELFGYISTWSATARHRAAHGTAALEALSRALVDAVPDPAVRITVRWPLAIKLARR